MARASTNPFAAAKSAGKETKVKSDDLIFVAEPFTSYDGGVFSKKEVQDAIEGYALGVDLYDQGEALKKSFRPTVISFAQHNFAREWIDQSGRRPKNPVLKTSNDSAMTIRAIFMDSCSKLDDASYQNLANTIGEKNAEANVIKQQEFVIDSSILTQEVEAKISGKVKKMTVIDAMTVALQDVFSPTPEVLSELFKVVDKFETKKGLIDAGYEYVVNGKDKVQDENRLVEFLNVGRFTTQLKSGEKKK